MAQVKSFFLPKETVLTITPDAFASGHIVKLNNPGEAASDFLTIAASTAFSLGPYNDPRTYRVTTISGDVAITEAFSGVTESGEGASLSSDLVSYDHTISGLVATNVKTAIDEVKSNASALAVTVAAITPFTVEAAQDATGAMSTNGTFVNLVYNDGANTLTPNLNATGTPTSAKFLQGDNTWSQVAIANLSASGTPSSSTFLRGDNTWATSTNLVQGSDIAANSNTTFTIDIANGDYQKITFSSSCTLAFTFPAGLVRSMCLELVNAGAFTITWPVGVKFAAATKPTFTSSGKDVIVVWQNGSNTVFAAPVALDIR